MKNKTFLLGFVFFWITALLFVSACSESSEKKVASGYTEDENATLDSVAYEKVLQTWEPVVAVDSAKRNYSGADTTVEASWYEVVFNTDAKEFYSYSDTAADSAEKSHRGSAQSETGKTLRRLFAAENIKRRLYQLYQKHDL